MPIALAGLAAGRRGGIAKAAGGTAGAGRAGRVVLAGVAAAPAKRAAAVLVAATVFATVAARPAHRALALQYTTNIRLHVPCQTNHPLFQKKENHSANT